MTVVGVDAALAAVMDGQWGLVTTRQAELAGVGRLRLSRLAAAGSLVRVAQGVYVDRGAAAAAAEHLELRAAWVGLDPARSAAQRLMADPVDAVVSHASAAELYGFGDLAADRFEFTVTTRRRVRRTDVRLHPGVTVPAADVTRLAGLPATTPARTIADLLADGHDGEHVSGVLAGAVRARQVDTAALATRVSPLAARRGFPRGDGPALVAHLLNLGGVADLAAADQVVTVARSSDSPVGGGLGTPDEAELARVLQLLSQHIATQMSGLSAAATSVAVAAPRVDVAKMVSEVGLANLAVMQREQLRPVLDAVASMVAAHDVARHDVLRAIVAATAPPTVSLPELSLPSMALPPVEAPVVTAAQLRAFDDVVRAARGAGL